jgi:hypothetical protein
VLDTAGVVIAVERHLGEGDGDGWCRPAAADGASPLAGRMASCLAITGQLTFVWAIAGRRPSVHRTGKEAIPAPGSRALWIVPQARARPGVVTTLAGRMEGGCDLPGTVSVRGCWLSVVTAPYVSGGPGWAPSR